MPITKCSRGSHKLIVLLLCLLSLGIALQAEIIVKYDKNGNKVITNTPSSAEISQKKVDNQQEAPTIYEKIPQSYLNKIKKLSQEYDLQEKLILAVAKAESDFNPTAVSRKGAAGIMQLMKTTAKDYGVNNRFDIDQNLAAGVKHLKYLHRKYSADLPLVLAAYNAGEEAVKKYKGIPPYEETRTYIKRVMNYMGLRYSGLFGYKRSTTIFKIVTTEGRIIITDTLPAKIDGVVTAIE